MSKARSLADLISGGAVIEASEIADSTITGAKLASDISFQTSGSIAFGDAAEKISGNGTDLKIESSGKIILDADSSGTIQIADNNTQLIKFFQFSNFVAIESMVSDKDFNIRGNDGGSFINAVSFDMSAAGAATFNDKIVLGANKAIEFGDAGEYISGDGTNLNIVSSGYTNLSSTGNLLLNTSSSGSIFFREGDTNYLLTRKTGDNAIIKSSISDGDLIFSGNDGGSNVDALTLDMSEAGTATFNSDVKLGDNSKITLGAGDDLQIYHDGTQSIIKDAGTGQLKILAENTLFFGSATGNSKYISAIKNGKVDLSYSNSVKLQTTSTGIDVTGIIGIGTSAASYTPLNTITVNTSSDIPLYIHSGDASNYAVMSDTSGSIKFGTTADRFGIFTGGDAGGSNAPSATSHYANNAVERLTIASGGDVGICCNLTVAGNLTINGTTTTLNTATLDIEDKTLCIAKGAADAAAANGAGIIVDGASACLCYTSGTDSWDFNKDVILPNNKKVIFGDAGEYIVGDGTNLNIISSNALGIDVPNGITLDSGSGGTTLRAGGGTTYGTLTSSSGDLSINQTTSNKDIIFTGNDAGTTITPLKLDMSAGGLVTTDVAGSTVAKWQRDSSTNGELTLGFPSTKATFTASNDLVFIAGGSDICLNNNTTIIGNISAGNFAGNNEIALTRTTSSPSSIKLQAHSNEPKIMFGTNGGGNYGLRFSDTSDNVLMKLTESGNLGIGTTAPGRNLTVFKSDYPTIQLINSTSTTGGADGSIIQLHHTDMDLVIRNQENADIRFDTNGGNERMRIMADGKIGIGTTSPTQKLTLAGGNNAKIAFIEGGVQSLYFNDTDTSLAGYFHYQHSIDQFRMNTSGSIVLTGGNVGIGTTSPGQTLTVAGDMTVQKSGDNLKADFSNGVNSNFRILTAGTVAQIGPSTASDVVFLSSNVEKMRMTSDGKFGIGTSAPTQKIFSAVDSTLAIPTSASMGSTTSGVANGIGIHNTNNSAQYSGLTLETKTTNASRWLIANEWKSNFNGDLVFRSRIDGSFSSEILRLKSDGKIGIGTTSPANNLHIHTDASSEGILIKSTGNTYSDLVFDANRSSAGNNLGRLRGNWNGTAVAMINFDAGDDTTNKDNADITFHTASAGTMFQRMKIADDGKIGIGTTSPDHILHISAASTNSQLKLQRTGSATASYNLSASNDSFHISDQAAGTERMRVTATGLGIGTSAPTQKLEVKGRVLIDGDDGASGNGTFIIDGSATSSSQIRFSQGGTAKAYLTYWDSSDTLGLTDGSASGLHFKPSTGNVGIGTNSPDTRLHLQLGDSGATGNNYSTAILETNNPFNVLQFISPNTASQQIRFGDPQGNGQGIIHYAHNGDFMSFYTNDTERMRITSGNVGIGTSSPSRRLHIVGPAGTAQLQSTGTTSALYFADTSSSTIDNQGIHSTGNNMAISSGGHFRLTVRNDGHVGIGETDPGYDLVVDGGANSTIRVQNDTPYYGDFQATSSGITVRTVGSYPLILNTNQNERMRISPTGDVGIGLTNPAHKLSVFDSSLGIVARFATTGNRSFDISSADNGVYAGAHWDRNINSAGGIHTWSVEGNEKMRITSAGQLGLGVIPPSAMSSSSYKQIQFANGVIADSGGTNSSFQLLQNAYVGSGNNNYAITGSGTSHTNRIMMTSGVISFARAYPTTANNQITYSESMRIASNGQVIIGATSAGSLTNGKLIITHDGNTTYGIRLNSTNTSGTQYHMSFDRGQTQAGYITSNSATTIAFNNASDERLKENIENSGSAIQDIKDLKVRQFDWKDNIDTHRDFGFVAQELINVVPEAVTKGSDELNENGKPVKSWGVDYSHLVPRLVKAVQEQQTKIEELEVKIKTLEDE